MKRHSGADAVGHVLAIGTVVFALNRCPQSLQLEVVALRDKLKEP